MDRQKLTEAILTPSKEISPQFKTWAIETTDGQTVTGLFLGEEFPKAPTSAWATTPGKISLVPFNTIARRQPLKTSFMPDKLHELLTDAEFRDLIAFLESLK